MKSGLVSLLINRLIEIEPTRSPLISCFVNLESSREEALREIHSRASQIGRRLGGQVRIDFDDAFEELQEYLEGALKPESKGVAIFARWGEKPVFLPLQFEVPVRSHFMVDSLPHIYPLIEVKDTYHRFVIAIVSESEARILETTIGSVTEEILERRPELRTRIGREWTKEHYRNHREEQVANFLREKVEIIEGLMKRGGHNHLIIAGAPAMVARLREALPPALRAKLIDAVIANPREGLSPILSESIDLFVAMENVESHDRVLELESAFLTNGLGVCGYDDSVAAIRGGYASLLLIDQECVEIEMRESLVREATRCRVPIETVRRNETMERLGGMGCLLRFTPAPVDGGQLAAA